MNIQLQLLHEPFSIFKVKDIDKIPVGISKSLFSSVTQSTDEISILCESVFAPEALAPKWRFLRYSGSLENNTTGIVSTITKPLSDKKISVFVHTTFDYGYFGVELSKIDDAISVLQQAGISIKANDPQD